MSTALEGVLVLAIEQAESGLCAVTGTTDTPSKVGVSVVDIGTGMNAHAAHSGSADRAPSHRLRQGDRDFDV